MDVILLERVEKLGQIGDVVTVKNGFARNYLLPRKKALRANEANKKVFEANRARSRPRTPTAGEAADRIRKASTARRITLIRQASNAGAALRFGFGPRSGRGARSRRHQAAEEPDRARSPDQDDRPARR